MEPKSSAVDPYPELISMHGSIILPSFMLLTKSARFGPKWCLSCPTNVIGVSPIQQRERGLKKTSEQETFGNGERLQAVGAQMVRPRGK